VGFLGFRLAGVLKLLLPCAAIVSLGLALVCSGCKKTSPETAATESPAPEIQPSPVETTSSPEPDRPEEKEINAVEGYAVWYDVPPNSLPKRRAGKDEFTAAHRRWPLGTMVRVTHLTNGKSVIVRITDRLVTKKQHALIDLSKEAAEKLEMISEGRARVRLEILPDDEEPRAKRDSNSSAAQP
jgi:rare lipoprotein A